MARGRPTFDKKKAMNSTIKNQSKRVKGILVLFAMGILISNSSQAQRYYRPDQGLYAGVEATYGTRSLQLKSDIEEINKLVVVGDGAGIGLVAGGRAFKIRLQQSFFSSKSFVKEKTKLSETQAGINIYPLQFVPRKAVISPYFITGIQMSNAKLYGSYVAEPVLEPVKKKECSCTCEPGTGSGPPANPDAISGGRGLAVPTDPTGPGNPPVANPDDPSATNPDETESENLPAEDRYLGKISTVRATMGMGLDIKLPVKRRMVNFYGELKYGQPFSSKATNVAFRDTKVSGLLSVDIGIRVGIYK